MIQLRHAKYGNRKCLREQVRNICTKALVEYLLLDLDESQLNTNLAKILNWFELDTRRLEDKTHLVNFILI